MHHTPARSLSRLDRANYHTMRNALLAWITCLLAAPSVFGDETVDYLRDIKPILQARCHACHAALKQESNLRLDTVAAIARGGDSGPAVVAGNPAGSLLFERVSAADEAERMPPDGAPLTAEQIATLAKWIAAGAPAPADESPDADPRQHWAFQPPRRPALPAATVHQAANPIDALLAVEHARLGLRPRGPVEKPLLLRRVYLDLIGLPPTRAQIQEFLADERPDAYERVVDELLARPQYGERWGRHWMDVWRYTDWFGLGDQLRYSQKHIWHWRDWIVESLNTDKGYDRMVVEMLAGDEIAPTDRDTLRATGYLARDYFLFNRTTWLDETIEHTSKAFLGLTINCAKCHDHKYDPITQLDYYRLRAIFEPHQARLDAWPGEADLERDGLARVFDAHPDAPTFLHRRGNEKDPDTTKPIEPGAPAFLATTEFAVSLVELPVEASNPALAQFVLNDQLRVAEREIAARREALAKARQALAAAPAGDASASTDGATPAASAPGKSSCDWAAAVAERSLAAAELRPDMLRAAHAADLARSRPMPDEETAKAVAAAALAARRYEHARAAEQVALAEQKLALAEAKPPAEKQPLAQQLGAAREALTKAEAALQQPGESYPPLRGSLKALEGPDETAESRDKPYPRVSTGRRAALARWIVSRQNPLAARVAVNHLWMRHFGQPLVDSVDDFGRRAPRPPLGDLLDWLAVELMDTGWSMKRVHRLMVTSQAYRRTTEAGPDESATAAADPQNHFCWRRRPLRMESQLVRDSLLHLAGALDLTIGGPSLSAKSAGELFRRSLYFTHSRDERDEFLAMFDDADVLHCYRRTESIVPQQALTMANSKLTLALARRLAAKLTQELSATGDRAADDRAFVEAAYETVLATRPTAEEQSICLAALDELRRVLGERQHPTPDTRAREDLVHALLNHNDFLTIR
jgi:hypothetical protein